MNLLNEVQRSIESGYSIRIVLVCLAKPIKGTFPLRGDCAHTSKNAAIPSYARKETLTVLYSNSQYIYVHCTFYR